MELRLAVQVGVLRAALALLPLALYLARAPLRAALRDVPRSVWLALAAVVVGGGVARALGSLWSVEHENALGWLIFEDAVALDHVPFYGLGAHVLDNAVLRLVAVDPAVVFGTNALLATLSPLLLFGVGYGLVRDARAGLLAAALLAFLPAHVRASATESLFVPLLFFALLGLFLLLVHVRRPGTSGEAERPGPLARYALPSSVGLSLALAVQMHPLGGLVLLPALLIVVVRAERPLRLLRCGATWMGVGVLVGVTALHGYELVARMGEGGGGLEFFRIAPAQILPRLASPGNHALVDPRVTPAALQILALLGLVGLAFTDRRALGVVLPTLLVSAYLHTTHGENPVDHQRFHLVPGTWAALLGGCATLLPRRLPWMTQRVTRALVAVAVVWAASGLWWQREVLTVRYDTQREYAFLRRAWPHLRTPATLVHLDRFQAERVLTTGLPVSWLRAKGKRVRPIEASAWLGDPQRFGAGPVIWYRGITCWTFDRVMELEGRRPEAGRGATTGNPLLRPLCRDVEAAGTLTPLAETSFVPNPDRFVVPAPRVTIGFYRLDPSQ